MEGPTHYRRRTTITALPERIRAARQARGVSMHTLAREIGTTVTAVYNWEHGLTRPTRANRARVERALGVSLTETSEASPKAGLTNI